MHPMPLECRDLSTFLPAYVDGEFAGTETAEIEDHLTGCAECRREVSVQEGLKAAVRRAAPALAPIELREAVQDWLGKRLPFAARVPRLPNGSLQGVRLSQLRSHPAALVAYDLPRAGGRVSLVIVDDPEEASLPGTARQVANRQVWLSRSRGYNVVSWKTNEIVYQLISDLDEQDVLQLVQAAELR